MRQCCGPARGFIMHVYDAMGQALATSLFTLINMLQYDIFKAVPR